MNLHILLSCLQVKTEAVVAVIIAEFDQRTRTLAFSCNYETWFAH